MFPSFGTSWHKRRVQQLSVFLRRWWRRLASILVLLWILTRYYQDLPPSRAHEITTHDIEFEASYRSDPNDASGFLPLPEAQRRCRNLGWPVFNARTRQPRRKIYDLLMINNEMDWLEIRMNTMSEHVDYFVILESPVTFTGIEKPLTLQANWDRFAKFHKQMIYKVEENPPFGSRRTWDYEDYQRNAMFEQVIPWLEGEQAADIGDVILVSDVDEIVRPATLQLLRNCDFPRRLTLRSQFYYYGFQFLHQGLEWGHPQATTYQGKSGTILPSNLRNGEGEGRLGGWLQKAELWNAGWHCSSCFATIEDMLTKMSSFSHMTLNKEQFRDPERIVDRVRKGLDLWDREGQTYEKISENEDIPEILKSESERFKYLLDREGSNAGFRDYSPEGDGAAAGG
jgi:beta-1,4-mannosyl-glycoprotein beta-1,4-N-acetylglucosaminyltransferase